MSPSSSNSNATYCCPVNSVNFGCLAIAEGSNAYCPHVFIGKFGLKVRLALHSLRYQESQSESVPHVLGLRNVFDILLSVVGLYSVFVIHVETIGARTDKGRRQHPVDANVFFPSLPVLSKGKLNHQIATIRNVRPDYLSDCVWSGRSFFSYSLDSSEIGDCVIGIFGDCFPDFFGGTIFVGHGRPPRRLIRSRAAVRARTLLRLDSF